MGTARVEEEPDTLLTITSPDSEKVANIRANPKIEWLIAPPDRSAILYLECEAVIVDDVAEIKRYWKTMPGKEKTFFIRYYNSGIGFSIIRSTVRSAVYVVPEEFRKSRFPIAELNES